MKKTVIHSTAFMPVAVLGIQEITKMNVSDEMHTHHTNGSIPTLNTKLAWGPGKPITPEWNLNLVLKFIFLSISHPFYQF